MKIQYFLAIALLIVVLFALTSNPSKDDYVAFAKNEITEEAGGFVGMISGPFINSYTTAKNYGLFSLYETKVEEDEEKLMAVGLFNNFIWISTPESSPEK